MIYNAIMGLLTTTNDETCIGMATSALNRLYNGNYIHAPFVDALNDKAATCYGCQNVYLGNSAFANGTGFLSNILGHEESHNLFNASDVPEDGQALGSAYQWGFYCAGMM